MDILLYPFGSKMISIWIQKDTKGYPFGSKRIQKDILLDPNRYPFVSFCIQKDILLGLLPGSPVGCQRCILETGPSRTHIVVITCSYPSR